MTKERILLVGISDRIIEDTIERINKSNAYEGELISLCINGAQIIHEVDPITIDSISVIEVPDPWHYPEIIRKPMKLNAETFKPRKGFFQNGGR